jgi:hypothetical protein
MREYAEHKTPNADRFAAVEVRIESLVLHGFSPLERYRVAEALRLELARLLREGGLPLEQAGEVARLDAGTLQVEWGAKAEAIGAQVAQAVYRGLNPTPEGGKEP